MSEWVPPDDVELIDIGYDVRVQYIGADWSPGRVGVLIWHKRPDTGKGCAGGVFFDLPEVREHLPARAVWQVESLEPLTIAPSVLCNLCGRHGFITGGLWAPA